MVKLCTLLIMLRTLTLFCRSLAGRTRFLLSFDDFIEGVFCVRGRITTPCFLQNLSNSLFVFSIVFMAVRIFLTCSFSNNFLDSAFFHFLAIRILCLSFLSFDEIVLLTNIACFLISDDPVLQILSEPN